MKGKSKRAAQPMSRAAGTLSLLPMEIQIGDRFTEGGFEWEVVTHPAAFQGGKSLRARKSRVPESETEMICPAHVRVHAMNPNRYPFLLPWVRVALLMRSIQATT